MSSCDPQPSKDDLYDSGVTNGDVDWLFRGKSKKLTKKMNLNKDLDQKLYDSSGAKETGYNSDGKVSPEKSNDLPPDSPAASAAPAKEKVKTNVAASAETVPESSTAKGADAPKSNGGPPKTPPVKPKEHSPKEQPKQKESKFDKLLGRSRSSSLTKAPPEQKRKSSLNVISQSFDGGSSIYGTELEPNFMDSGLSSSAATFPKPRSNSAGSSGSNKDKKSLFSALSSKFKSGSGSGNSSPTTAISPSTSNSAKSNPNFLLAHSSDKEPEKDLSSLYSKPPPELAGIPIKRKNSVTENQLSSSVDSSGKLSSSASSLLSNSLFKRRTSVSSNIETNVPRVVLNRNPNKKKPAIKELRQVDLKRVTFAIDKLAYDPQQQIPSRKPKKGNVLIPEDLLAPPPRLAQGISMVDGSSRSDAPKYTEKELTLAREAQKRALIEAEKHAQEAHMTAKKLSHEVQQYRFRTRASTINEDDNMKTQTEGETDEAFDDEAKKIEIDKPLHMHENHFDSKELDKDMSSLSLEAIYTRCCHLREILAIPATLKQLKNKTSPLQVLKLLNPKPTLIDALSFSDFIAIVPINAIIFDNVVMTTEMLKHFLASLSNNKFVEKLSLRNVPIDETGWKYLCKFLSENQSVKKLDISQQRIKPDLKSSLIRSSMNWKLFTDALVERGGMDELVINGCKLSDEVFKDLMERAVKPSTYRLGIASCELNCYKTSVVCDWIKAPDSKCVGVDVAFNDLSQGQLKCFIDCFQTPNNHLLFFSLYQTNLSDICEATELLKVLTNVKTLRFLDLSSLPDLFPGIISKLNTYLPKFESLKRIHFDLNELSSQSIIAINDILPKVNGLLHVSYLGNKNINTTAAGSIYSAVKKSNSIFTVDVDYDLIDDKLAQRIALYLMRNMDNVVNLKSMKNSAAFDFDDGNKNNLPSEDHEDELLFDGSLLMETAEKLLTENENRENSIEDIKLQRIILNALLERTREVRKGLHEKIDELFAQRNEGSLTLQGKESLLRFCLLDASLEKLVHMFEEQAKKQASVMSPTTSVDQENVEATSSTEKKFDETNNSKKQDQLNIVLDQDLLHQSSNELITAGGPILSPHNTETLSKLGYFQMNDPTTSFQPHQVVVDSTADGTSVPIDYLTGRPVLMRSISQTSTHAKEQELEEGEFHRWGFFMQARNNSTEGCKTSESPNSNEQDIPKDKPIPALNALPSGSELREAIIAAKGIESITELIDKIGTNRVSIDKIYDVGDKTESQQANKNTEGTRQVKDDKDKKEKKKECATCKKDADDEESIDSTVSEIETDDTCPHVDAVFDEVYDKLLNDAQRVISKSEAK